MRSWSKHQAVQVQARVTEQAKKDEREKELQEEQLRQVKPSVGSHIDWKRHEDKQTHLKRQIQGMHLEKKYKGFCA